MPELDDLRLNEPEPAPQFQQPRGPGLLVPALIVAAIIGIGLNLRLTPALQGQAGQPATDLASLCAGAPPDRNRVAAALIAALAQGLAEFEREGFHAFAADYARHDLLRGRPLQLSGALGTFDALGAGIDARGALRVQLPDGSERRIDSADVTVRRA